MLDAMTEDSAGTGQARRRRAPAMSQEERRAAIIEATVPLLLADGADVSTTKIAEAAGIAEGTVFRAFQDKKELLMAASQQALEADAEVRRIGEIDRQRLLPERLTEAVDVVGGYLDRIWSVVRTMQAAGISWDNEHKHRHGRRSGDSDTENHDTEDQDTKDTNAKDTEHDRRGFTRGGGPIQMDRVSSALAELFAPEAATLRADPELAARLLLGLVFTNRRNDLRFGGGGAVDSVEIVDLFLHGALAGQAAQHLAQEGEHHD
jgi:AcrR family transcriptional regulator